VRRAEKQAQGYLYRLRGVKMLLAEKGAKSGPAGGGKKSRDRDESGGVNRGYVWGEGREAVIPNRNNGLRVRGCMSLHLPVTKE
jgi:hypothetical protein